MPVHTGTTSRRTEGLRVRGRSARVVDEVLRVTLEELGRVGYAAMRIDDIARISSVNKTTIYRRWATKLELVAAALRAKREQMAGPPPDTGSLREDLLEETRDLLAMCADPAKMGIARVLHEEQKHPEVIALRRTMRAEHLTRRMALVERAVARGELPAGTDAALVIEAIFATLTTRLITLLEQVDEAFTIALVDLVLAGARAGGGVAR